MQTVGQLGRRWTDPITVVCSLTVWSPGGCLILLRLVVGWWVTWTSFLRSSGQMFSSRGPLLSNDQRPTTNDQRPTTNDQRSTSNAQRPTSNGQRSTVNGECREIGVKTIVEINDFITRFSGRVRKCQGDARWRLAAKRPSNSATSSDGISSIYANAAARLRCFSSAARRIAFSAAFLLRSSTM